MATTAAVPTPHIHAHAPRNVREERRGGHTEKRFPAISIEERTAVLETRWEETVPTLATKADIGALENRLVKWGIGAGLALLGVFAAVFIANTARMDALNAKLEASMGKLDTKLEASVGKLDASVGKLDAKLEASVGKLDAKLDASVGKLDAKIDALAARQDARMDALDAKIDRIDAKIDTRFDALLSRQEKLDTKFDEMMAELREQRGK